MDAVAHSLGGQYNIPHGLANAVLLPVGLEMYGPCRGLYRKLWTLGRSAGVVKEALPGIRREDIPVMAAHAAREANPLYPVPRLMDAAELAQFYERVMETD